MGELNFDGKNLATLLASLILVFALNLIGIIAKMVFDSYKDKTKKTDDVIRELQETIEKKLKEGQEKTEKKLDQFQGFLTSYITDTIRLSDRMQGIGSQTQLIEKSIEDVDLKLRRINSAIKLIAGEDWPRIKKEITEEDFK